jgi:hypothetical protein
MTSGPAEQAGKTAQSAIEALKSTPAVLAIVIFNVLFMALSAWTTYESGNRYERLIETAFKACNVPAPPH